MNRLHHVLLVEDDEFDEKQALRSIDRSGLHVEVDVARDGEEACELLRNKPSEYRLILLDIKLPKVNGFEVLLQIRRQPETRYIPVVMLTSSNEAKDIERALDFGANSYIQKEIDSEVSDANLKIALYYWLIVHTSGISYANGVSHFMSL